MESSKPSILYVVNVDWFFISHRLPLAIEALARNNDVYLAAKNTGCFPELEKQGIKCIDVDFERSGKNPVKEFSLIGILRKLYREIAPDIIHHVTLKPSIYGTLAVKRIGYKGKVVNAISGLGYTFTGSRWSVSKVILLALLRLAFSDKRGNFIFQNPDDLAFYRRLNFLTEKNHLIIKGSGVDENIFKRSTPRVKRSKLKVVLLARMLKDKGVFEFIRAAQLLRRKYEDRLSFVLVGGIDIHNPAAISEDTLHSLCNDEYLQWLGQRSDVKEIYEDADIVCLPSYREGLPKSLVEAMAMECPVITTDAIGCRECVDEGVNGFLVPIGDDHLLANRIEMLALNDTLREQMGKNSREKMIREMSLSSVIDATFDFYEK